MDCDSSSAESQEHRAEERRVVTTLFCDLVGFTAISERHDPELVDAMLRRYYAAARRVIESYGGSVEKYMGDAVVAVFGVPSLHKDDPERAVRAGLRLVDEIDALPGIAGQPLEVRVGVNTGDALVRLDVDPSSGEGFLTGDAVNVSARLQSAAPPMAVAVGETAHAATEKVFAFDACHPVSLKGKSQPLRAWLATAPLARTGSELRSFKTSFVGRKQELEALLDLLHETSGRRSPQSALIVGEPGIGKSRLLAEFARRLDETSSAVIWRQGRCLPFGSNVTFWALSEIVKACAGILESDGVARAEARLETVLPEGEERDRVRARLRPLVGLEAEEATREENFAAWRRFLEDLARTGPTVLVVEDLHWADESMLAFMDYLAGSDAEVPLLVLATARPEILGLTAAGAGYVAAAQRLPLGPLSGDETAQLLLVRLNATSLPVSLQAKLLERSGGNPLFAEELVRLLEDRGLLETRAGQTTLREGVELPMPDSIGALIAARLDLLAPGRKMLLSDASVVGRTFWAGALAAIGDEDPKTVLDGLMELVAKELVHPERSSSMEGETQFTFVHALVCDVAYAQLTKADRAAKHAALAQWLEERTAGRTEDLAEVLAYHYGTALELATSCGLDLEDELLEPTERYLALAGGRAAPLDSSAAAAHFAKAEQVSSEALRPKRWLLTRRTRRTLRRRAPLLAGAVAVIAVAGVLALAISLLGSKGDRSIDQTTRKSMSPSQIAVEYGPSVVRITTPPMPPTSTGRNKPSRIVGSGFMATKDGVVVTSTAVLQGMGRSAPVAVRVEYALGNGDYGSAMGMVWDHDEQTGIALVKVDPKEVPLDPLPMGDSETLTGGQRLSALGAQRFMTIQRATGEVGQLWRSTDDLSGAGHVIGFTHDLRFPAPPAAFGGPLFDEYGQVMGVVGPAGRGVALAWNELWKGDVSRQAVAAWWATFIITSTEQQRQADLGKAYLGVEYRWLSSSAAEHFGKREGALVEVVSIGSPAARGGVRGGGGSSAHFGGESYLLGGDLIVGVDGVSLRREGQLPNLIQRCDPGDTVPIALWRHGRLRTLEVTLGEMSRAVPQSVVDAIIKDAADGKIDGDWKPNDVQAALEYLQANPDYQRDPLDPSKAVTQRPGPDSVPLALVM